MGVVRVMDASGIAEDLSAYPVMYFIGGDQSGVGLPVIGANEINWWVWALLKLAPVRFCHISAPEVKTITMGLPIVMAIKNRPEAVHIFISLQLCYFNAA